MVHGVSLGDRDAENFMLYFQVAQNTVHENAQIKGWWKAPCNDGMELMLMVRELSEACEALRDGNLPSAHILGFTGLEEELADVILRVMSYAGEKELRLAPTIIAKMKYNATRPHRHGGKAF